MQECVRLNVKCIAGLRSYSGDFCACRLSMTAAAGVLTGLAKLKRQDSARSQQRPIPPSSAGLANPAPEGAPRSVLTQSSPAESLTTIKSLQMVTTKLLLPLESGNGALMSWSFGVVCACTRPRDFSSSWGCSS